MKKEKEVNYLMKTNINLKTDSINELSNELKKGSINLNNILDYLINLTIDMCTVLS